MKNTRPKKARSPCHSKEESPPEVGPVRHAPAFKFDPEEYTHFLADCDWTEDQKVEFTHALWKIIVAELDMRFGMHPVQQVMADAKVLEVDSTGVLNLPDHCDINNNESATRPVKKGAGREDS